MHTSGGLGRKLLTAVLIPAVLISITTVLGVFAAGYVLEEVLIKQALVDEAEHFFLARRTDPDFPTPDTENLKGYLEGEDMPDHIHDLGPGFHKLTSEGVFTVVYVSERQGERLFLIFIGEQVRVLALYFGLVPLAAVLLVIYLSTYVAYRMTKRAVSPVIALARDVERLEPDEAGSLNLTRTPHSEFDLEVATLYEALKIMVERVNQYVDRERTFTRDASHELRSPLTVIKISTDMLLERDRLDPRDRATVERIKRAASDMEELVEAFLLLARESDRGLAADSVELAAIVEDEVERASMLLRGKGVEVRMMLGNALEVNAPHKVLSVLVGNLVRNAFSYTDDGVVQINLADRTLVIDDSGVGMSNEDLDAAFEPFHRATGSRKGGHGVGLTIVRRIADRFKWQLEIESQVDVGTRVTVRFPDGRVAERAETTTA